MAERTLTIGVGNELRGDDGAGLRVADLLAARGFDAIRCEGEPIALLDLWEGADAVFVVDAVAGAHAGRIWRWQPGAAEMPLELRRHASTHLLGLGDVLQLAERLGRAPRELTVIGIEGDSFELGSAPSPAVEAAVFSVAAAVVAELSAAPARAPASDPIGGVGR